VRERKPNIKALARRGDIDGLTEAAGYQEFSSGAGGTVTDQGIQTRAEALVALGKLAPERARHTIRAALHDPADEVRCEAVRVMATLDAADALAQALRWLSPDGLSYGLALETISAMDSARPAAIADALVHREDDEPLDEEASRLILTPPRSNGADASEALLELLIGALGDERDIVVERAAELLVRLSPESVEPLVSELTSGQNPAEAAHVLGRLGEPRTLRPLMEALQHGDARVRQESAGALGELRDPAAIEPLLQATHDSDRRVRAQAGAALDRLGSTAVIVGVAALMQPMVEEAVRSAMPAPSAEEHSSPQLVRLPPRAEAWPRQPNGGSTEVPGTVASDESS
jgi:HEAT repeat protein